MNPRALLSTTVSILSVATLAFAQTWTEPIIIGGGNAPDLDIDPATGTLYITHHDPNVIFTKVDWQGNLIEQEAVDVAARDTKGGKRFNATVAFDPVLKLPHICFRENDSGDLFSVYYTRRRADGTWKDPLQLISKTVRAYSVRIDVDSYGVAHVVHGRTTGGSVRGDAIYYRIVNHAVDNRVKGLTDYRVDDRVEITVGGDSLVHVILSSPDDFSRGGAITYYRSVDGGRTLDLIGDIAASSANSRNGSADIYADRNGSVHIAYGTKHDRSVDGTSSIRYARFEGDTKVRDLAVTKSGELQQWDDPDIGIGSVAASDDGHYVVVAYVLKPGGKLRARLSDDGGATWSAHTTLSSGSGGYWGRDKHVVRAWANTFYLVYPAGGYVYLRILKVAGNPPRVNAGGPYSGTEGSPINFDASASSDDGQIVEYKWDWTGDGTWDDSTASPQIAHTYPDDFSGSAILEVVDNDGMSSQTLVQVTVANVAPVAEAGGPYVGAVNKPVSLTGNVSDIGTQDTHTYKWDLDNDGTFDKNGKSVSATFTSMGTKVVRLRVRDDDGGVGIDTATVEIGSGKPVISSIPNQSVQEGDSFAPIPLDNYVQDADHQANQMSWSFFGNQDLQVTIQQRVASVAVPDSEWAGTETISFVVKDPENKSDTTSASFTVNPVNDPPVVSKILFQSVKEGTPFDTIHLDDVVFDADNSDDQITWHVTGAVNLVVTIVNRVATVAPADSEWSGFERIWFVARDPGNASDSTKTKFTIAPVNDPPRITGLADQTVNRGESFPPLDFSKYVHDPDDPLDKLALSASGNRVLEVTIEGLVATVSAPDSRWTGSEQITFTVTDTSQATGSAKVNFTVRASNSPPRWIDRQNYAFNEDDTLHIPIKELQARVRDDEDPPDQFRFSMIGNQHVRWQSNGSRFSVYAEPNWNGIENVQLIVDDGLGGRDSVATQITVRPVPDPLAPFSLLEPIGVFYPTRPDSIVFIWEASFDADNPLAKLRYLWILSRSPQIADTLMKKQIEGKTDYTLGIDSRFDAGVYFWQVVAISVSDLVDPVPSQNVGAFTLPPTSSVADARAGVPEAFALRPNYPNPFNPQTTIAFDLPKPGHATVTIYGLDGKRISTLIDANLFAGYHQTTWNARGVASGVYLLELRVEAEGKVMFEARRTMSLVR